MAVVKSILARGIFLLSSIIISSRAEAGDYEDIITASFRNAIVKIDVSTNTPIQKDGRNICVSEGTGFLISSSYVVTAEHVYKLVPECGAPIIILKSRKHNAQRLAQVMGAKDDVALLKLEQPLSSDMCALRVMSKDIFGVNGIRFGIPGTLQDPGPPSYIQIGEESGEFSPLVVLKPVATEAGESGGPVIYLLNVVGVTRAKHAQFSAYSFMTRGSNIASLIAQYNVKIGSICNPVDVNTSVMTRSRHDNTATAEFKPNDALSGAAKLRMRSEVAAALSEATISTQASGIPSPIVVSQNINATVIEVRQVANFQDVLADMKRFTGTVSNILERNLWQKFIEEQSRANKWAE